MLTNLSTLKVNYNSFYIDMFVALVVSFQPLYGSVHEYLQLLTRILIFAISDGTREGNEMRDKCPHLQNLSSIAIEKYNKKVWIYLHTHKV